MGLNGAAAGADEGAELKGRDAVIVEAGVRGEDGAGLRER
jgi:hypothetical protein